MAFQKKDKLAGLLASAVQAVNSNQPFYATKAEMQGLLVSPHGVLVEFNESIKENDVGPKIAFRATQAGMQAHQQNAFGAPAVQQPAQQQPAQGWAQPGFQQAPQGQQPAQQAPRSSSFQVMDGLPIPTGPKRGRGSNVYPFDTMNVGQHFRIPATAENPNPAKSVASTVSSATRRLAPKTFTVRSIEDGSGKYAVIWRTA